MTFLVWYLLFLPPQEPAAKAGEAARIHGQIQSIDDDLNKLTDQLDALAGTTQTLSQEIGQIELQRAMLHTRIEKHELELKQAAQQVIDNAEKRKVLEAAADQQRQRIGSQLKQLYKRGHLGHAQILLKQSRLTELINAYHYARVLTKRDQATLAAYSATIADLERLSKELIDIRANAKQARLNLERERVSLQKLLNERATRLKTIRQETSVNLKLLNEMELEKEEMLLMVRRLVETDTDPMKLRVPIQRYKGKLDWPLKGTIRRKFGVYRDPEFGTRQKQNGLAIGVVEGTAVKAIYSGRVLFADWFKSYGNVVIVDHGDSVLSFYAHLQKALVSKGTFVEKGAVIAKSGDTGSLDGPLLHFEIRNKAEPEDPQKWLK